MTTNLLHWLKKNEPLGTGVLLGGLFLFFSWVLAASEGYIGDADSLTHYKFSRYSWLYPEFLLHHWGKPVFTLLSSWQAWQAGGLPGCRPGGWGIQIVCYSLFCFSLLLYTLFS